MHNLIDGKVENLKVWIYDEDTYLCPTEGVLNQNMYRVLNGSQLESMQDLPSNRQPITSYLYSGQMQDGFPNGKGFAIYDNNTSYEGTFNKGLKHGNNTKFIEPDGTIFEGSYRDDLRTGRGKLIKTDGSVFEGLWRDGKINGEGRVLDAHGKVIETGTYIE